MVVVARLRREHDGANAVEFAILLPILLVLLFGVIYGGFAFNTKLTITQAAREGARFGATLAFLEDETEPHEAWFTDIRDRVVDTALGDQGLAPGDRYICVRYVDANGVGDSREFGTGDCTVDASSVPAGRERVEVVVSRPSRLDLIFYGFDINLRSVGIARYEAPATPD